MLEDEWCPRHHKRCHWTAYTVSQRQSIVQCRHWFKDIHNPIGHVAYTRDVRWILYIPDECSETTNIDRFWRWQEDELSLNYYDALVLACSLCTAEYKLLFYVAYSAYSATSRAADTYSPSIYRVNFTNLLSTSLGYNGTVHCAKVPYLSRFTIPPIPRPISLLCISSLPVLHLPAILSVFLRHLI